MKHVNHITTKSYFINRFGKLSTAFMFYQMQEIAWEHANLLGFGYEQLKENNQFWVLSRLRVKIDRRPSWRESFSLETWSRGTDGFFGYRDYNFVDSHGNNIIQATSSWLILDGTSRRIVRLNKFKEFPEYAESVFGTNASRIKAPDTAADLQFSPVMFTDIDINQHFNSGRYLERIINSYPFTFLEANELAELEVNFLKEGMPDDNLAVKKQHIDALNHICSVIRQEDGAELIRARLIWKDKQQTL